MQRDRDIRQYQVGCIGFAVILHAALILFVASRPALSELATGGSPESASPVDGASAVYMELSASPKGKKPAAPPSQAAPSDGDVAVKVAAQAPPPPPPPAPAPPPPPAPEAMLPKTLPAKKTAEPKTARADGDVAVKAAIAEARIKENKREEPKPVATPIAKKSPPKAPPKARPAKKAVAKAAVAKSRPKPAPPAPAMAKAPKEPEFASEDVEDSLEDMDSMADSSDSLPAPRIAPAVAGTSERALEDMIREGELEERQREATNRLEAMRDAEPVHESADEPADEPTEELAADGFADGLPQQRPSANAQRGNNQRPAAAGFVDADGMNRDGIPRGVRNDWELREAPGNRKPIYPREDRLKNRQGSVTFVAFVKADGTVKNVQIERTNGSNGMQNEAAQAMQKWRFLPGQAGWVRKTFTFSLTGQAQEDFAELKR